MSVSCQPIGEEKEGELHYRGHRIGSGAEAK